MKNKLFAVGLIAAMALSMVACGKSEEECACETGTSDASFVELSDGYVFNYDGTDIILGADAAPIVEKLGEPKKYFEAPSCAADGISKTYTYDDFEFNTQPDGDKDRVCFIALKTDNVSTPEGINLSSSKEDIANSYGDAEFACNSMIYSKNGTTLTFLFGDDGNITAIQYAGGIVAE